MSTEIITLKLKEQKPQLWDVRAIVVQKICDIYTYHKLFTIVVFNTKSLILTTLNINYDIPLFYFTKLGAK